MHPALEHAIADRLRRALAVRVALRWMGLLCALAMCLQLSHAQSVSPAPANGQTAPSGSWQNTPNHFDASQTLGPSQIRHETSTPLTAWPDLPLSALPRSALLRYRLSGVEKGIHYQATSELHWQHNASAYAMNLSLKVFLLGTKNWRSQGQITSVGLEPVRFTDIWRKERAVFFDRSAQRIVFHDHATPTPMQMGAQDQVSLYAQMATAMAHSGGRWPLGTRLQVQTATVRDALPWILSLEKVETLTLDGRDLQTTKWVAQRLNRDDSLLEFWISDTLDWLPARIRISQTRGSVIDLQLTGREALPNLPH
jgi:hypothetical protein